MARDRGEKHRYGQHYTPARVASLLAELAVRSATDLVLDPACGDGRLLAAALAKKRRLLPATADSLQLAGDMFGLDRTASAIPLAAATEANVACADFFDIEPGTRINKSTSFQNKFDAIIGNPPYIRHEVIGRAEKRRIEKRLEDGRNRSPELHWPQWSGRSDMYVYFFAHAARFLRPEGRLVFLTASSWLDSRYGDPLREFMLENFRIVAVIESKAESFFDDASINTAITVLEREQDAQARDACEVSFITLLKPLGEILRSGKQQGSTESHFDLDSSGAVKIRTVHQSGLKGATKAEPKRSVTVNEGWSRYLRADDVFFEILKRGGERLKSLASFAGVRFGIKTGANDFFYVRDANSRNAKGELLALGHIASVRRGLTTGANEFFYLKPSEIAVDHIEHEYSHPPLIQVEDGTGNRHLIESIYLAPVIFSLKEIASVVIESRQTRRFFFNCTIAPDLLLHSRALEYISSGERAGYNHRPTCAGRNPWYAAARGIRPAPIIFPAKVGERWIVALNSASVYEDKKLYGIFPRGNVSKLTLAALLNSTWVRYYTEVTCRQMTGAQAIADIDVRVAESVLIPDPRSLPLGLRKRLESALRQIARRSVRSVFEEINLRDRRRLDELTLEAMGFEDKFERGDIIDRLYAALTNMVKARLLRKTVS